MEKVSFSWLSTAPLFTVKENTSVESWSTFGRVTVGVGERVSFI